MIPVRAEAAKSTKNAAADRQNLLDTIENRRLLLDMQKPLLKWFEANKRDLPWRKNPNAYQVWVSEIMLQQTRVEAVKEYYRRFLKALPDIKALAHAQEDQLLKLWEGLGYYNRVRNMQKAALIVLEQYDSRMPADFDKLLELPGIGSYTAGAIASIAYQIPVPAVDGNVLRICMRILENDSDIQKQSVKKSVEKLLLQIMPKTNPGAYNQALMELGATVCVPNGAPKCGQCPAARVCQGYLHGTAERLPVKSVKKQRKIEEKTLFVILDEKNAVLRKREPNGLLAGLYEIPNTDGSLNEEQALQWVKAEGFRTLQIEELPSAKHIFSHIEWRMKAYLVKVQTMLPGIYQYKKEAGERPFIIAEREKIKKEIPIPSAFAYYQKYIERSCR